MKTELLTLTTLIVIAIGSTFPKVSTAQEDLSANSEGLPEYLQDRGPGMPTSMFGTYIRKGELLIYPFHEYYYDNNMEYEPADFGFGPTTEFRGRYRANETLIFLSYGFTDRLAIEFEAGIIGAELNKSKNDFSALPEELEKFGLSDVEGQIRWRWTHENAKKPEVFSYFETVFPLSKKNSLIGTSDWEFKLGTGLIKGFKWGTVTLRLATEYSSASKKPEIGEYALEYLKRLSNRFRFFAMVEGSQDEVALVPEIQWHVSPHLFIKINNGFGVTSKATDFAPEFGVVFSL